MNQIHGHGPINFILVDFLLSTPRKKHKKTCVTEKMQPALGMHINQLAIIKP